MGDQGTTFASLERPDFVTDHVRETIDRNGRTTTSGYDNLYRLTQETWFASASDSSADRTLAFGYDLVGNLTTASEAVSGTYAFQ
ncbi:MAG: hypothetical protein O3C40_36315 [Planctomycetota bacterium]|nr:hypothetical protein [Planctomycetota bacterium]